jgi:hypothetical protein
MSWVARDGAARGHPQPATFALVTAVSKHTTRYGGLSANRRSIRLAGARLLDELHRPQPPVLRVRPEYNAVMRTTCVATLLEAGHAENALPQSARATVNCRVL